MERSDRRFFKGEKEVSRVKFIAIIPPILLGGFVAADTAIAYRVPLDYYIATISVIGAMFAVVKGWKMVRDEMKSIVGEWAENHAVAHEQIKDAHEQIRDELTEIKNTLNSRGAEWACLRKDPEGHHGVPDR